MQKDGLTVFIRDKVDFNTMILLLIDFIMIMHHFIKDIKVLHMHVPSNLFKICEAKSTRTKKKNRQSYNYSWGFKHLLLYLIRSTQKERTLVLTTPHLQKLT